MTLQTLITMFDTNGDARHPVRDPNRVAEFSHPHPAADQHDELPAIESVQVPALLVTGNVEVLDSPLLTSTSSRPILLKSTC